jgi:hypothetical protein
VYLPAQDRLYATLANKELTKKMSPTNAKALNTMRQRLRKHNPQFAEEIEKFRWVPSNTMSLCMATGSVKLPTQRQERGPLAVAACFSSG